MNNAILVLNAGSSSLKFSVFIDEDGGLRLHLRGAVDGLTESPRFIASDASGKAIEEKTWAEGFRFGHGGAVELLL